MTVSIPVLCYHAHIISSNDYAGNAHIALAEDLQQIQALGKRIVPLTWIVDWLQGKREDADMINAVGISFDDGTLLDFQPVEHPQYGTLPGLLPILQQFARQHQYEQPSVHASCFVIASPLARSETDRNELHGCGWLNSDWWLNAEQSGLMAIENHSWDHNNISASEAQAIPRGSFTGINNEQLADHEIRRASKLLQMLLGHSPQLFAFPYGDSNSFLRKQYLPSRASEFGLRAAFTIEGKPVHKNCDIWSLPRYVHGFHWRNTHSLKRILKL